MCPPPIPPRPYLAEMDAMKQRIRDQEGALRQKEGRLAGKREKHESPDLRPGRYLSSKLEIGTKKVVFYNVIYCVIL